MEIIKKDMKVPFSTRSEKEGKLKKMKPIDPVTQARLFSSPKQITTEKETNIQDLNTSKAETETRGVFTSLE